LTDGAASDRSDNGYDATVQNGALAEGQDGNALVLDGSSTLSLPFDSVGYPFTVSLDLFIDESTPADAVLFSGADGELVLDVDGAGSLGYRRGNYSFTFDTVLPRGEWVNLALRGNSETVELFVNRRLVASGVNMAEAPRNDSSTFVLPTESIGSGLVGMIDNLSIYGAYRDAEDITGYPELHKDNIALSEGVTITASSEHGAAHLVLGNIADGNPSTRWSSKYEPTGWVLVDLGDVYDICQVNVLWENACKYRIQASMDGEHFTEYATYPAGASDSFTQSGNNDFFSSLGIKGRYIKLMLDERQLPQYGYSIFELEIYAYNTQTANAAIERADELLNRIPDSLTPAESRAALVNAKEDMQSYIARDELDSYDYNEYLKALHGAADAFEQSIEPLVISGVPESGSTRNRVTLSASRASSWTVNGVETGAAPSLQLTEEGVYTVSATDIYGVSSEPVTFSIDRTAPVLTASAEHYGYTNQDVHFNANEEVTFYNGTRLSLRHRPDLTESVYNIRAIDKAGNHTAFYHVTIMKEAPVLTGMPEGVTRSNIAIRSNVKVLYTVDGVEADDYAYGLRVLDEGKHTVKATDMAGNETTVSFEIDRTKPTFTASVPSGQP
ncbi:MAG: discoidin domain-containing protein, partial [Oscillospiraceae bacterium]